MNTKRLTLSLALSLLLIATAVLLPIPAKVNAAGGNDTTPPVITDVRVITNKILRPGWAKFEIDVVEKESGINVLMFHFRLKGEDNYDLPTKAVYSYVEGNYSGHTLYTGTHEVYMKIPANARIGEYELYYVYSTDREQNSYQAYGYASDIYHQPQLPNDANFLVEDEFDYVDGMFNINAPELTEGLTNMEVGKAMRVEANTDTLEKEHLDAIKGQDKTIVVDMNTVRWVIKGTDITEETKDINLGTYIKIIPKGTLIGYEYITYTAVDIVERIEEVWEYDEEGDYSYIDEEIVWEEIEYEDGYYKEVYSDENMVEITFATNGALPGKMQVRFKSDMLYQQENGVGYVYYVKGDNLKYEGETDDMIFDGTDKWCYMTITHNSTFVVSNRKGLSWTRWGGKVPSKTKPVTPTPVKPIKPTTKSKTYFLKFNLNKGRVTKKISVWGKTIKKGAKKINSIKKSYKYKSTPPKPAFGKLPTLTRKGYKFLGWYVGAKKATAKTKVSKTTATLKAKWKKNKTKGKK